MRSLRRFLLKPDTLRDNRWLRWLGPSLFNPRLWTFSRRTIALGMALGVFFGLLIPIAQIPFSAAAAVALRANVPAAVASTLVTNPVTFGPVYYAAWQLGRAVLGEAEAGSSPPSPDAAPATGAAVPDATPATGAAAPGAPAADAAWWERLLDFASGVGKPLVVGLAILAVCVGLLTYVGVSWAWALKVWWQRRRRVRMATRRSA